MKNIIVLNIVSIIFVFFILAISEKLPFINYNHNMKLAAEAEKNRQYEVAIQYYQEEVKRDKKNAELWVRISDLENYLEHYDASADALKQAIKIESNNAKLYIKLSETYAVHKNPEKSMAALQLALKIDPNNISYLNREAELAKLLNNYELAKASYQKILAIDPLNQSAKLALEGLESEIIQNQYHGILRRGIEAETNHEWKLAIQIYTNGIKKNPGNIQNADLWRRIYDIQSLLKQDANAIISIKEAIKLDPNDTNLYIKLSESYGTLGDMKAALETINEALAINPLDKALLKRKLEISSYLAKSSLQTQAVSSAIPSTGLVYEGEKKWNEAIRVYKEEILKKPKDPKNYDILLRIADIENYLKNYEASAKAVEEAIKFKPKEIKLYIKLSEIYGLLKNIRKAFCVIQQALKLNPNNIDLLKNYAVLANNLEYLDIVQDSYGKILDRDCYNKDALIGLANLKIKKNYLDAAVADYRKILALYPKTRTAWLDYVKLESWRGNFSNAFAGLESYRSYFGSTKEYYQVKARVLAMVNYPKMSLCDVKYLESQESPGYDLMFTRTLALFTNNQFSKALKALQEVQRLYPDEKDNKDLGEFVTTPLRSFLTIDDYRSYDSDKIGIHKTSLKGRYFITHESGLILDIRHEALHEPRMNGLQTLDNHAYIWDNYQQIGFFQQFCPEFRLEATGGTMQIQDRDSYGTYNVKAILRPTDRARINLQIGREFFAVSPKAVSYAIRQSYRKMDILWEPVTRFYIAGQGEYGIYSDGNRSGLSRISPRIGVIRRQYLNFDVGGMADWLHYSFYPVPYHGYWSPHMHRTFQFTTLAYYKDSHNIAYIVNTGAGVHKDETMASYAFAGDLSAQVIVGIYCDWNLILSSSASLRVNSSMFNNPVNTNYRAYNFNAILTRRF